MTDAALGSVPSGNPPATSTAVVDGSTAAALATPPAAAVPPIAGPNWLEGADELRIGYVQNKGWKEPGQLLDSYMALEKTFGADKAGRTVILPGEKAEPAEVAAFYEKLGRPAEAKDYKVDVPTGYPAEFADGFKAKAHELGLTAKQVEGIAAWNNETVGGMSAARQNQTVEAFNADVGALKTEWGAAHDQNVVIARNAASALGWDAGTIDKLSGVLGHKGTMAMLHQIGSKTGESDFVAGNGTNFGGAKTPAQAKAEIQTLRSDKAFTTKLMNKDADSLAKWQQLHNFAYPEPRA